MRRLSIWVGSALLASVIATGCQNQDPVKVSGTPAPSAAAKSSPASQTAAQVLPVSAPPPPRAELVAHVAPKRAPMEMTLVSRAVTVAPVIDGVAGERIWKTAPEITTRDYSSQRPITIKSVVTAAEVFFLVTFPAESPGLTHKTWTWDRQEEVYREGPDREDVLVVKWSMSGNGVDLRLREPRQPHRGDIWFWKAVRTNPSGYADDKWQAFFASPAAQSRKVPSRAHGNLYFVRSGDTGDAPWEEKFYFEYQGDRIQKYVPRQPTGSRGDVRAKGVWANGQWTIELGRALRTGHDDDIDFAPGGVYLFGVACYAMALDTPQQAWSQPLYRTGDVFDRLLLSIPAGTVAAAEGAVR